MNHRSKRLQDIDRSNAEFEKKSPYNFCDRWCERCPSQTQLRCTLYKDELERKMICLAHGKDEDDSEITEAFMDQQFAEVEKNFEKWDEVLEEAGWEPDDLEEELETVEDFKADDTNPLVEIASEYHQKTHEFLKVVFYGKEGFSPQLKYDFDTLAWYHTLILVKLKRALSGFLAPRDEDEFSLGDAVAQFLICKKGISQSLKVLAGIQKQYFSHHAVLLSLSDLLRKLEGGIESLEDSIQ